MPPEPSLHVVPLATRHAAAAAELHRVGIGSGFLSSLGPTFLRQLYRAVPGCPCGFGSVCEAANGQVLGFVACATDTGRLYKQAIVRRGIWMALPLVRFFLRPAVIRRMWQTWRYPSQVGDDLPAAELLSIAVAEEARGQGVGGALMRAIKQEFARRGVERFKIAVGAQNAVANAFYRKHGCTLAKTRMHHGQEMNVYVVAAGD